jgi:hypothetical protein
LIVTIYKCKDEELENTIREASFFFALHLLSNQMIRNISVNIYIKKHLSELGTCTVLDVNYWNKPRDFEIHLKKSKKIDKMISTLAHEFVHLKQFAKMELNESLDKWKSIPIDSEKIEYHDLPWEVEATCLEEILFHQYKQYKYFDEKTKC